MAQRQHIVHYSDLSEKEITDNDQPTVQFALDGKSYEIDLTDAEQTDMRDALALYVGKARPAGRSTAKKATSAASQDTAAIREWAKEKGYDVPERGRLPKEVKEAYAAK